MIMKIFSKKIYKIIPNNNSYKYSKIHNFNNLKKFNNLYKKNN